MFNLKLLADDVLKNRKETKISQSELAESTGINRVLIGKLEKGEFTPSIEQFEKLCLVLGLEPANYFKPQKPRFKDYSGPMNIAVAGTGYVGLSLAVLLAQHNHVVAVDVIEDKVNKINNRISPIQDDYIEKYLAENKLDLVATLDGAKAYRDAEIVIIAAPTNYDAKLNFFDTKYVEHLMMKPVLFSARVTVTSLPDMLSLKTTRLKKSSLPDSLTPGRSSSYPQYSHTALFSFIFNPAPQFGQFILEFLSVPVPF